VSVRGRLLILLVAILLAGGSGASFAQAQRTPEPYQPDEFPAWLSDVWRAEVVLVGSFPFTLFITLEVYDFYRYFTNGLDPSYAPWPLGAGVAAALSPTETAWLAASAISLSVIVSGVDFLLGRINPR
jgi:hypothetical protein